MDGCKDKRSNDQGGVDTDQRLQFLQEQRPEPQFLHYMVTMSLPVIRLSSRLHQVNPMLTQVAPASTTLSGKMPIL